MNSAKLPATTLAALGIVYGDIGTSVLYTVKEVFGSGITVSSLVALGLNLILPGRVDAPVEGD